MRKEEAVDLHIEQTHQDGTFTKEWRPYKIKVSYDSWIQTTRANIVARNQRILEIKRNGLTYWRADDQLPPAPESPRSTPLF